METGRSAACIPVVEDMVLHQHPPCTIPDTGELHGEPSLPPQQVVWGQPSSPEQVPMCCPGTGCGEERDAADGVCIAVASRCRSDFKKESAPLVQTVPHLGSCSWNTLLLAGEVQGCFLSASLLRACKSRCCANAAAAHFPFNVVSVCKQNNDLLLLFRKWFLIYFIEAREKQFNCESCYEPYLTSKVLKGVFSDKLWFLI